MHRSNWVACPICRWSRWVREDHIKSPSYTGLCRPCSTRRLNWNGGTRQGDGHIKVLLPNHPRADKDGYIRRSRLTLENSSGKPVEDSFVVHHINGDAQDDRAENLKEMSKADHARLHAKSRRRDKLGHFRAN